MTDPTDPTSGNPEGGAATPPGAAPSEDPTSANPRPEAAVPPTAAGPVVPQSPPAQRAIPAPPSDPPSAGSTETVRLGSAQLGEERSKRRFRWSTKTTIAAAVVALALATGVSGVVYAVTSSDGESDGHGKRHGKPGRVDHDRNPLNPGALRAGMYGPLDALHGEFTVQGTDGNYVVKFTQVGVVTEIDSDSLTVKSADGYTKTYAIDSDTVQRAIAERDDSGKVEEDPGIDKDETVAVTATVSGDQATADSIAERGKNSGVTRPLPGGPDQLPLPRGHGRR